MNEIAIIAPTASGKTELSLSLASKLDAVILSLDSLSVYKYIDIVSAKPTIKERSGIKHFGIDVVEPNKTFDVMLFIQEYKKAKQYAKENQKDLVIVGGSSFYLKVLIEGISQRPQIDKQVQSIVQNRLKNLKNTYEELYTLDKVYMENIKPTDRYRIEKALEIYLQTGLVPSVYFNQNKPKPISQDIKLFQIQTDIEVLRQRISLRTKKMLQMGLIDEVISLEKKYTRESNSMQSIGIKETLDYLDGKISKIELENLISIHTAQLAKRQRTFNKTQFRHIFEENLKNLENKIISML